MSHEPNLEPYKWKPGQSGNPAGRKKKYTTLLREQGYKKQEVTDCIQVLISMKEKELQKVSENEEATILEQIVALALLEAKRKKSLYNIETLLTRVYGQPKQEVESKIMIAKFNVRFNDDKPPAQPPETET